MENAKKDQVDTSTDLVYEVLQEIHRSQGGAMDLRLLGIRFQMQLGHFEERARTRLRMEGPKTSSWTPAKPGDVLKGTAAREYPIFPAPISHAPPSEL